MTIQIVIMAAGKGKRMQSRLPKVLHPLAGIPMLERVITTALDLQADNAYVIYGHEGDQVKSSLEHLPVNWIEQTEQFGTGHAVMQALPYMEDRDQVLILSADVPIIQLKTLQNLLNRTPKEGLGLITAEFPDPAGLGRIIRDQGLEILGIVEEKDATAEQQQIKEIYSGIMLAKAAFLKQCLPILSKENAQGEYYLTDIIAMAAKDRMGINSVSVEFPEEVRGANSRSELAILERFFQKLQAQRLMAAGVTIMDPARIDIRGEVTAEPDVTIDVNVVFEGKVHIGRNSKIGPHCVISDSTIANDVTVLSHTVMDQCEVDAHCSIGPFARVRPGTKLQEHAKLGNFVEVKKSEIGTHSKVSHLSYIGDCIIGANVNVGAGTITCNYDGYNKHPTIIGDGAFIGSGTELVAPVTIGAGSTIAAGSTITNDAPPEALTIARTKQRTVTGWKNKNKK